MNFSNQSNDCGLKGGMEWTVDWKVEWNGSEEGLHYCAENAEMVIVLFTMWQQTTDTPNMVNTLEPIETWTPNLNSVLVFQVSLCTKELRNYIL